MVVGEEDVIEDVIEIGEVIHLSVAAVVVVAVVILVKYNGGRGGSN